MTHEYNISGMTCKGCVAKVKSELLKLGDVINAEVQLEAPQATITMQHHIPTEALQTAIGKAGQYSIAEAQGGHHASMMEMQTGALEASSDSYYPIYLIFGYVAVVAALAQWGSDGFNGWKWMQYFMAGFFLVFSFFKLLNIRGFAEGYRTYDVVAKHIPAYGFIYPFIELALGLAFLTGFRPVLANTVTLVVMGISTIGVAQSLLKKTPFQCACLGTVIKLPLSKVTLVEDVLMVAMSAAMLVMLLS